jgi:hypothetical protein
MLYAKNGGFPISDLSDLGDPEKKQETHGNTGDLFSFVSRVDTFNGIP